MNAMARELGLVDLDCREWKDATRGNEAAAAALGFPLPSGPQSVVAHELCKEMGLHVEEEELEFSVWEMQLNSKLHMMTCCANLAQCLIESIFFTSLDEATAARVEQFDTISDAPERCSRFVEELHADPTSSYVVRAETAGH